jgi:hypothetical protein
MKRDRNLSVFIAYKYGREWQIIIYKCAAEWSKNENSWPKI